MKRLVLCSILIFVLFGSVLASDIRNGDVDCSSAIDMDDVIYLLRYIFDSGPSPCVIPTCADTSLVKIAEVSTGICGHMDLSFLGIDTVVFVACNLLITSTFDITHDENNQIQIDNELDIGYKFYFIAEE